MRYLIDTNIWIDHFRGDSKITVFLEGIETAKIQTTLSVITEYELLAGCKLTPNEEERVHSLLKIFPVLAITSSIVRQAAYFHRTYNTQIVDALIAATAFKTNATLLTRNTKHFQNIKGIKIGSL